MFVVLGLFLVLSTLWPILHYEFYSVRWQQTKLLSPVTENVSRIQGTSTDGPSPLTLTDANNWFIGDPNLPEVSSKVKYYNLTIPALKIKDSIVEIGGNDLSKHIIHYSGTALPGREGNAVIFGHSSLPQFYSPSNYLTIFTKLPSLVGGDKIYIDYDGITYTYRVEEMFEVGPTDIQVLEQHYDNSFLTLVTCVPPGTFFRRLIVRARLVG